MLRWHIILLCRRAVHSGDRTCLHCALHTPLYFCRPDRIINTLKYALMMFALNCKLRRWVPRSLFRPFGNYTAFYLESNFFSTLFSRQFLSNVVLIQAMKSYRGSRGITPLIPNLGDRLRWVVNVTLRPAVMSGTYWIGSWVGRNAGLDVMKKIKCCLYRDLNPGPSSPWPKGLHSVRF